MSNYLKKLIETAGAARATIEITATDQGLNVVARTNRGSNSEPVTKSTAFWIDKNEDDMVGRLEQFLKLIQ